MFFRIKKSGHRTYVQVVENTRFDGAVRRDEQHLVSELGAGGEQRRSMKTAQGKHLQTTQRRLGITKVFALCPRNVPIERWLQRRVWSVAVSEPKAASSYLNKAQHDDRGDRKLHRELATIPKQKAPQD